MALNTGFKVNLSTTGLHERGRRVAKSAKSGRYYILFSLLLVLVFMISTSTTR